MPNYSPLILALCFLAPLRAEAAQAADLVGTWSVDVDATWDHLKKMPEVTALSSEQAAQVKTMLIDQMKSAVFTFSADTLTSDASGVKKEEKYTVTRTDGDTLYTTDTAADGHVGHSQIDVAAKRLTITNSDKPSEIVVLVRQDPPADGK